MMTPYLPGYVVTGDRDLDQWTATSESDPDDVITGSTADLEAFRRQRVSALAGRFGQFLDGLPTAMRPDPHAEVERLVRLFPDEARRVLAELDALNSPEETPQTEQ